MINIIVGIVVLLCGLVGAMAVKSKRNSKRMLKEAIAQLRVNQRAMRFSKWKDRARKWKVELKKPVKMQFD